MDGYNSWRGWWLRETPPGWADDDDQPEWLPRRWNRDQEPFEDDAATELYPGGLVMEDLDVDADEAAAVRVLARYTVVRVLLLSTGGLLHGSRLRLERRVALEHLALLPDHDWERRRLEHLITLCQPEPTADIADALIVAAEAAAKRAQIMGAFALYRAAYDIARRNRWWAEAARAAHGIARLARLEEARYSIRLWERRARVLDRRASRSHDDP